MISTQPVGIHHYLSLRKTEVKEGTYSSFYCSWEDALWDLLEIFSIPKNAKILVPSFFCMDVIENMKSHHLRPIYYPMDKYFTTAPKLFNQLLKEHQPKVVVIFHPVGMTNKLFTSLSEWKQSLPPSSILIEDCVHRIVNAQKIQFISERHFIIDSLRKVVPLAGSNLYHQNNLVKNKSAKRNNFQTSMYRLKVLFLWAYFQILLSLGNVFSNLKCKQFFLLKAEKMMQRGYDIIGDNYQAATGWWFMSLLAKFINHAYIANCKVKQVKLYNSKLRSAVNSPHIFFFPIDTNDYSYLRAFPVGVYTQHADEIIEKIRSTGILVKSELDGCPWTKDHKVVYLPLGPHLSLADIADICIKVIRVIDRATN